MRGENKMADPVKLKEEVQRFLSKDMKVKLIVMIGILGMALILISQFMDTGSGRSSGRHPQAMESAGFTNEEYIRILEERLQTLISEIEGVGRNKVMITLESGVEYVYAQEQRRSTDATRDSGGELPVGGRIQESVEQRFILVDTEFGRREALVLTRRPPRVRGVVIVCEGADNILVQEKLISVVTTALGIPSTRVSVVQIS